MESFWFLFWICLLLYFLFRKRESPIIRKKRKIQIKEVDAFLLAIQQYVSVLSRKKEMLTYKDDYGFVHETNWMLEKEDFLKKLNYQPIIRKEAFRLSQEDYMSLIEEAINKYSAQNMDDNDAVIVPSNPFEYERYCAQQLNLIGWNASVTKASGDHGVDIIAERDGLYIAVQCKLYSGAVSNKAIQEVSSGMKYWKASKAVVITNSTYTKHAVEIARTHNVYLLHHDDLPKFTDIICCAPVYP